MKVRVIDKNGIISKAFEAPQGFQLERYVDSLYPENEIMAWANDIEINVTVFEKNGFDAIEVYVGYYK